MVFDPEKPLVTLPINATEDRVVGGWKIEALMRGDPEEQIGLLEEAHGRILYVDEVNLLDDHIVNIILDVASTGRLSIQREGRNVADKPVSFTLVGTMNPEEGNLRPQLLDRFGLMVHIAADPVPARRLAILQSVIDFDRAVKLAGEGQTSERLEQARAEDVALLARLQAALQALEDVRFDAAMAACINVASDPHFKMQGHRGDLVMLLAARALAALRGEAEAGPAHVRAVARMALQHRRLEASQGVMSFWASEDDQKVCALLGLDPTTPPLVG
jgi:magnesium chelatase subunit I